MKVTFYSNFLNHHQLPFCNEMYNKLGKDFKFVATEEVPEDRLKMGYDKMEDKYPFLLIVNDKTNKIKAMKLSETSDIVIIGSAPEIYVKERLENNKIVFRYYERFFKRGQWRIITPKNLRYLYKNHTKYRNKNVYMLCASAYTANDFKLANAYKDKTYKWGYFPEVKYYNLDDLIAKKNNSIIKILWVGRLLKWKHPEKAIQIANKLKKEKYQFELTIIGCGELEEELKCMINKYDLLNEVKLIGAIPHNKVRGYMEKANIFLFTSDYNEGWGAVLNEAMNSACSIVASHAIGAVPFLIKNNVNGFVFKNNDINNLYNQVKILMDNKLLREEFGMHAYKTIINLWNANNATDQLLNLFNSKLKNKEVFINEGPCSMANPIKQSKMYKKLIKENNNV